MNTSNNYTLLKQRKNKRFNYKHKFSIEKKDDLDEVSISEEFGSKWQRARKINTNKGDILKGISMRMLIIILVLLLIGMYILDF